jgi:hypothetical protein
MYSRKDFLGTLLKAGALVGAGGMLTLGERSALSALRYDPVETLYFEAESMSFSSLSGISVVSDSRANGGRVLMMTTESSAFKNNVTFWGTANEVRIMVRAQSSGASWPVVAILVDGREVGRWTINSTGYQLSSALISPAIPDGSHNVELRAVSGMSGSGALWVDFIQFRSPEAQQPPPSGTVYFEDSFDRDADTFTNWDRVHVMNNTATTDPTVKRSGTHSLKLSVQDIDSNTFGWSGVRSHLVKTNLFREGLERYIGWSTYVPADHPNPTSWFNMAEFGYTGNTMPPTWMELRGDGHFALIYDATRQHILKWRSTVPLKGAWHDFVIRILFHRNPAIGFAELWVDGVPQTMANGQTRIYYSTLNPAELASALSHLHICNYRDRYQMLWSTIYHDAVKVGDSYTAVDPAG